MRILLAEDDRQLAEALARRLAVAGHAVDVFPSVADAEAAWTLAPYDLAIIDVARSAARDLVSNDPLLESHSVLEQAVATLGEGRAQYLEKG